MENAWPQAIAASRGGKRNVRCDAINLFSLESLVIASILLMPLVMGLTEGLIARDNTYWYTDSFLDDTLDWLDVYCVGDGHCTADEQASIDAAWSAAAAVGINILWHAQVAFIGLDLSLLLALAFWNEIDKAAQRR